MTTIVTTQRIKEISESSFMGDTVRHIAKELLHLRQTGIANQIVAHNASNPNGNTYTQDMVMQDIANRKQVGIDTYGKALSPFNGRSSLIDAYEEALDLTMYLANQLREEEQLATMAWDRAVAYQDAVYADSTISSSFADDMADALRLLSTRFEKPSHIQQIRDIQNERLDREEVETKSNPNASNLDAVNQVQDLHGD